MRLKTLEEGMRVYMTPHDYQTMLDCADSRRAHLAMRLIGEGSLRVSEAAYEVYMERLRQSTHPDVDLWFHPIYGKDTKDRDTDGKRRDVWIPQDLKEEMETYQKDEGRSSDVSLLLCGDRTLRDDINATAEHAAKSPSNASKSSGGCRISPRSDCVGPHGRITELICVSGAVSSP